MKLPRLDRRTLAVTGVIVPLAALFLYVGLRSGPLAPVRVTVASVESRALTPALFGIGTIEARYTYRIGPTTPARLRRVDVQVGDIVHAGQLLGDMDPVDLDERLAAQKSVLGGAESAISVAEAQVQEATARFTRADTQGQRYDKLLKGGSISEEEAEIKRQDLEVSKAGLAAARANLDSAHREFERVRADRDGLISQRANLRLVAPVTGLVVARNEDPGTTVIAGQTVIEIIDPSSLWINVRFNQLSSSGLQSGLPARIVMRSQADRISTGHVLRVEPLADAVTEETLAKVTFDTLPDPMPAIGELAEVTVALPTLPVTPVVPNASVQRVGGRLGVWLIEGRTLRFAPVTRGTQDLDGSVQILDGLKPGDRVVVHSQRALNARSRVKIVERLPGVSP